MKIVLDACLIGKLFVDEDGSDRMRALIACAKVRTYHFYVPSLLFEEILSILTKSALSEAEVLTAIEHLHAFSKLGVFEIVATSPKLQKSAAQIALLDTGGQGHISSYDATYHALALELGAEFLTDDRRHVNKTKNLVGAVTHFSDFEV